MTMFDGIKAIIFDLDGTLVDSMGIWRDIDIEYLGRFGMELPDDLQSCLEGKCFHDTAIYMKDRFDLPDPLEVIEKDWNDMAEDKYCNCIPIKDGIPKLLSFAKDKGMKLGIATSNSRHLTNLFLRSRGLTDTFDYVLTGCDTLKSKPDPEVYQVCAKRLKVNPAECLVFEDITKGILSAKNAGMRVCGVYDKYSEWSREEKIRLSDYYIESYNDIEYPA